MAQLKPLGAQRPNPNAFASFGQIRQLVNICDGLPVGVVEPVYTRIVGRLPEQIREQLPGLVPPLPVGTHNSRTALPLEQTYRLFSQLGLGYAPTKVIDAARGLRDRYVNLVPTVLLEGAMAEQSTILDGLAKRAFGRPDQVERRARFRIELGPYGLREAEMRAALAEVGAVDLLTSSAMLGIRSLLGDRGVALVVTASEIAISMKDLLVETGRTYAGQLAADMGVPIDSAAFKLIKAHDPQAAEAWERDPSFRVTDLVPGRPLQKTTLIETMEAGVDVVFTAAA